ncbi:prepilin-type N-terminal cleavage/methylation domain-containing protein [Allohahella marinimesophila]|uniref:Prepilin-type N-terminal cleavage/methylation domain-containing protein n=1 Tax=Allohahella marinimesophila TaxID=1054972 RepID=A0ABP7NWS9_9GAMM
MSRYSRGFTLVELILVLLLVSALAVLGIGLFSNTSSYASLALYDQIISQSRLAQQVALGRHASTTTRLSISSVDDKYILAVSNGVNPGVYQTVRELPREGVQITWKDSGTTGCGGGSGADFAVHFDPSGDLISPNGLRRPTLICLSGEPQRSVCLSTLGFAHEGPCDQ